MNRHTSDLKHQIERILHWEQPAHWRLRDFVYLSELIHTHTRQRLDAYALQAFWQSSIIPSNQFLDTLARFADYADWENFCARNSYGEVETDDEIVMLHAPMWDIPTRWVIVICWLSAIAAIAVAILLVWKR